LFAVLFFGCHSILLLLLLLLLFSFHTLPPWLEVSSTCSTPGPGVHVSACLAKLLPAGANSCDAWSAGTPLLSSHCFPAGGRMHEECNNDDER
jgi:hypothetical protein